jgi:hypothetical protein
MSERVEKRNDMLRVGIVRYETFTYYEVPWKS